MTSIIQSDGTFKVNRSYQSDFTIKIERLQYQGLLGQPGNVKIEVDYHQNVVIPGKEVEHKNVWRVAAYPIVMAPREICAEKIRAVSQRARYRDFYDLYLLIHDLEINFEEAVRLLEQKEIRTPVIASNIADNWSVAKEQIDRDLGSIYCSHNIPNQAIEAMIQGMHFDDIMQHS